MAPIVPVLSDLEFWQCDRRLNHLQVKVVTHCNGKIPWHRGDYVGVFSNQRGRSKDGDATDNVPTRHFGLDEPLN
jgi:hypothetical protein